MGLANPELVDEESTGLAPDHVLSTTTAALCG